MVENHICNRCGESYDWYNQDPPEGATFHWVPKCPVCYASITDNPPTKSWMNIISNDNVTEIDVPKVHAHTRLYHGRLAGYSVEELIERAQYFDEKASYNGWSPRFYRVIAYRLRKQARDQLNSNGTS